MPITVLLLNPRLLLKNNTHFKLNQTIKNHICTVLQYGQRKQKAQAKQTFSLTLNQTVTRKNLWLDNEQFEENVLCQPL